MPSVTTATVKGSKKSHFFLQRLKLYLDPDSGPEKKQTPLKTDPFKNIGPQGLQRCYLSHDI